MPFVLLTKPVLSLGHWQISELQLFTSGGYLKLQIEKLKFQEKCWKILQRSMAIKVFYLLTKIFPS